MDKPHHARSSTVSRTSLCGKERLSPLSVTPPPAAGCPPTLFLHSPFPGCPLSFLRVSPPPRTRLQTLFRRNSIYSPPLFFFCVDRFRRTRRSFSRSLSVLSPAEAADSFPSGPLKFNFSFPGFLFVIFCYCPRRPPQVLRLAQVVLKITPLTANRPSPLIPCAPFCGVPALSSDRDLAVFFLPLLSTPTSCTVHLSPRGMLLTAEES